ncbi:MAG: nicotinamide-nucleotide amidohydrolase family protein [Actinomycetales bacterium]|nr:nicotinamide-nucleotide amidohydrolase family protein [Actinomycetales bacterium]
MSLPPSAEAAAHATAAVLSAAQRRGWHIATAESLTGGLLCAELTRIPGSSAVVSAGVVVYTEQTKSALLGIDAGALAHHGVYSEWTARAMAEAVRRVTGAQIGVATTGVAGPGADLGVAPGTVHIAVASPDGCVAAAEEFQGTREQVRHKAVHRALDLLLTALAD